MSETRADLLAWALDRVETGNLRQQVQAMPEADLRALVAEMRADEAAIARDGRLGWLAAAEDEGREPGIRAGR